LHSDYQPKIFPNCFYHLALNLFAQTIFCEDAWGRDSDLIVRIYFYRETQASQKRLGGALLIDAIMVRAENFYLKQNYWEQDNYY